MFLLTDLLNWDPEVRLDLISLVSCPITALPSQTSFPSFLDSVHELTNSPCHSSSEISLFRVLLLGDSPPEGLEVDLLIQHVTLSW